MASPITDDLVSRVIGRVGDNTSSFTAARIIVWLNEAQDRLVEYAVNIGLQARPANPIQFIIERIPELISQVPSNSTDKLDSSGIYGLPEDFMYRYRFLYGSTSIDAKYANSKDLAVILANTSWDTPTSSNPIYTIEYSVLGPNLHAWPEAAVYFLFEYVGRPIQMVDGTTDTNLPSRFFEPLVTFAATMCRGRQTDEAGFQLWLAQWQQGIQILLGSGAS